MTNKFDELWNQGYALLKKYKDDNGDTMVVESYCVDNVRLGFWVKNQRTTYKKNKLSQKRIDLLNEIEFIWDVQKFKDKRGVKELERYYAEHGRCFSTSHKHNGVNYGSWLCKSRLKYKKGTLSNELTEILTKYEAFPNYPYSKNNLEDRIKQLLEYEKKYGTLNVPHTYDYNGNKLGRWVRNKRRAYYQNRLSEYHIKRLNEINFSWNPHLERAETYINNLIKFYNENGHLVIRYNDIIDGVQLGKYTNGLRSRYKRNLLSEEMIALLKSMDFIFDLAEYNYQCGIQQIIKYKEKYNTCLIPLDEVIDDFKIGRLVSNLRSRYWNGQLSTERINQLNEIGFIWDANPNKYHVDKWLTSTHERKQVMTDGTIKKITINEFWNHRRIKRDK